MADTRTSLTKKSKQGAKMGKKKPVKSSTTSKKPMNDNKEDKMETESEDSDGEDDESEEEDYSNRDFSDLIEQVNSEYTQAWDYIKPKWDEWALRLKLYNNQKRDKEAVGDNTLFTIFQTVLASLYSDQLTASFTPPRS